MLYFGIFIVVVIILPAAIALIIPKKILGFFVLSVLISAPILTVLTWQYFAAPPDYGGNGIGAVVFSTFVIIGLAISFTVGVIRYAINRDKARANDAKSAEDLPSNEAVH